MNEKKNNRRRYVFLGVLAALALSVGIYRCADEAPEELQVRPADKGHVSQPAHASTVTDTDTAYAAVRHLPASLPVSYRHSFIRKGKSLVADVAVGSPQNTGIDTATTVSIVPADTEPAPRKDWHAVRPQTEPLPSSASDEAAPSLLPCRFPKTHRFRIGLFAGAGYSRVTGLGGIVEDYDMRPTYTIVEKGGFAPQAGLTATWQFGRVGAELSAGYMRLASKMTEEKHPQAVTETTRFHDDFITSQLLVRVYAFPMFYMGAGMSAAVPSGKRNIDFSTDRTGQVYRQQAELTRDHLRETLKTRVLFSPTLKLGYANPDNGLEVGLSYGYGINDLLQTRPNDYGYRERKNNVHHFSLTIGYSIPLDKKQ